MSEKRSHELRLRLSDRFPSLVSILSSIHMEQMAMGTQLEDYYSQTHGVEILSRVMSGNLSYQLVKHV